MSLTTTNHDTHTLPETDRMPPPAPSPPAQSMERPNLGERIANFFLQFTFWQYLAIVIRLVCLPIGLAIIQILGAAGLREAYSDHMSARLFRYPGFSFFLAGTEEGRRVDIANLVITVLFFGSYVALELLMKRLGDSQGLPAWERVLLVVCGFGIVLLDAAAFCAGIYFGSSTQSPIPAIGLSLGYTLCLVMFAYVMNLLTRKHP